ncbi:MAG: tetratricopeptide repeat protein, partial [Chthoniobacterales bacterium]
EKDWAEAVAKAQNNNDRLDVLQRLAFQWHWPEKGVAVLWLLAENPGTKQAAPQTLYSYYAAARDTSGLYRTLTRLVDLLPDDPQVKNNYAQISLLLHADLVRAQLLAHDVHEAHPDNPAFASPYAFSLFQHDDVKGALKVMKALTPAQLQDPSVATYYGIILAAAGQELEASRFLNSAGQAKLLPEEETLVAQARRMLARQKPGSGT